jgi:hypothetical protein
VSCLLFGDRPPGTRTPEVLYGGGRRERERVRHEFLVAQERAVHSQATTAPGSRATVQRAVRRRRCGRVEGVFARLREHGAGLAPEQGGATGGRVELDGELLHRR